jgi:hypothetical protein
LAYHSLYLSKIIILITFSFFRKVYFITNFSFLAIIAEGQFAGMSISILASIYALSRVAFDALLTQALGFFSFQTILVLGITEEILFIYGYGQRYIDM